jgi:hypothetical protein
VVVENRHGCALEIREAVIKDVRQYIGPMKVFDDIAILNDIISGYTGMMLTVDG